MRAITLASLLVVVALCLRILAPGPTSAPGASAGAAAQPAVFLPVVLKNADQRATPVAPSPTPAATATPPPAATATPPPTATATPPPAATATPPPTATAPPPPAATSAPREPTPVPGTVAPQLLWFYRGPLDEDIVPFLVDFDRYILTKTDERHRDAMRLAGKPGPFLQYLRFEAIHDPRSCTAQPWRNQVADRPGDFCRISAEHPDWFLLDAGGQRIVDDEGGQHFYLMDPGHPGWRAFWLERARAGVEQLGWDGIFLDNVEASLSKRARLGALPAAYPSDAHYQAAVADFLSYLHQSYFKPQGRPLYANIIALSDPGIWFRYLEQLDGAMEEGWAVGWSDGYLSASAYAEHLSRVERTQQLGKEALVIAQGARQNEQRQLFAYASYLLVHQGRAAFRYAHYNHYGEGWSYTNYQLDLGQPLGPRYKSGGLLRRDFARGRVVVDPKTHTATISIP